MTRSAVGGRVTTPPPARTMTAVGSSLKPRTESAPARLMTHAGARCCARDSTGSDLSETHAPAATADGGPQRLDMLTYMKRTTVKIPDDVDREMRDEAERRGLTVSDWTREAIEAYLPRQRGRRRLLAAGAGRSGSSDVSVRIEEILGSELPRS